MIDTITQKLKALKICTTKGLKSSGGLGYYVRSMIINGFGCSLWFSAELWGEDAETPIWLSVKEVAGNKWIYSRTAKNLLSKLEFEIPSRLVDDEDAIYIPIFLRSGVEQDEVIDNIIDQINEIVELLKGKQN